jgi:multicomponent Na+:H+ antiporter subunit E
VNQEDVLPDENHVSRRALLRSVAWRVAGFLAFWLVLAGPAPHDLPAGMLASGLAAWTSLRLSPPSNEHVSLLRLARFIVHFLHQAIRAGIDVAFRALSPQLRIQPGFVLSASRLPPGGKRDAFCAETSLSPGTLPAGLADDGRLLIHCLDVSQPVSDRLAAEEVLFMRLFERSQR